MKTETSKIKSYLNKNFYLWLKLKMSVFDTSFENKHYLKSYQITK